jgi:hypothetical protein
MTTFRSYLSLILPSLYLEGEFDSNDRKKRRLLNYSSSVDECILQVGIRRAIRSLLGIPADRHKENGYGTTPTAGRDQYEGWL